MASRADIANLALTLLGSASKITSLTDNSVAARALNGLYDLQRKALLRRYHWSFALSRKSLAALATAPDWGFGTAFPLPSDYLRMVQVNDVFAVPSLNDYTEGDVSAYAIESIVDSGGNRSLCVLTDFGAPLKIRYVYDCQDEAFFDSLFVEAFAARLAYYGCEQITQSNTKKDAAQKEFDRSIRDAVRTGAIEKPPQAFADDSWIMSRL